MKAACWVLLLAARPALAQRLNLPPPPQSVPAPQKAAPAPPPEPDPIIAGHDLEVGIFYYNRGDYVGALARFEDAIFNDPASAEAYCRAGDTQLKLKQDLPAKVDFQRCLRAAESGKWADHARKELKKSAGSPAR